jgi:hypothetical protein
MIRPFGEANFGAIAGAMIGAVGGLFAIGIPPAIIYRSGAALFGTPKLALISFLVSGLIGWFIGGQFGPLVGQKLNNPRAEMVAGGISGLLPAIIIGCWSWYMVAGR